MDAKTFSRAIVSIEKKHGVRCDAYSVWIRMDNTCGKGWDGVQGQCKRSKPVWKTGENGISTGGFDGLEPGKAHDPALLEAKIAKISKLVDVLERGHFKDSPSDPSRIQYGKSGALTALRDAKNSRVGLISARNKNGMPVGFMSYKPGRSSIEIQNLGSDQSEKGIGRSMFESLISVAAKSGKGITVAPTDDAIGFYERMGMTKDGDGALFMTKQQVKSAFQQRTRDG